MVLKSTNIYVPFSFIPNIIKIHQVDGFYLFFETWTKNHSLVLPAYSCSQLSCLVYHK